MSEKNNDFGIGELGKIPETTPMDSFEAMERIKIPAQKMVKCSCGHTVPAILVMSTSSGTSCPDCYDRMEDGD
jgi:hypothetical protein